MPGLIGVGDNTVDTYSQAGVRYPGGNAVNVAVFARRCGIPAAYLGSLGDDARGRLVLNALAAERVDTSHCKVHTGVPNAFVEVHIEDGERVFGRYDSGAAALLVLSSADLEYIQRFDAVHTSIYSFLEGQAQALRAASRFLSVDFSNDLHETALIQPWLPLADLVVCSLSGYPELSVQQVAEDFIRHGARMALITRGNQGSWLQHGGKLYHQEVLPAQVVDTIGAGDAYIASFVTGLLQGRPAAEAMWQAAAYAALACEYAGAFGYGERF